MVRLHTAAGTEPDPDQDIGDPVATFLRRRPARAGTVLTQPPPPPPEPVRAPEPDDEPGDGPEEAARRLPADVVADIDRLLANLTP